MWSDYGTWRDPVVWAAWAGIAGGLVFGIGWAVNAANQPPISGIVVNSEHHDDYTSCTGSGKTMTCTHHPQRWELSIRDASGKVHERDVKRATFLNKPVGSHFTEVK